MFITQTASIIDELLSKRRFQDTKLYKNFQRLLYVPISKVGSPADWMYLAPIQVDLSLPKYYELAQQLEADYYNICDQLNQQLSESNFNFTSLYNNMYGGFAIILRSPIHFDCSNVILAVFPCQSVKPP